MSAPGPVPGLRPKPGLALAISAAMLPVLILFGFIWVRGTWSATDFRNPAGPSDGAVAQLYRTPEGRRQVRCSLVVEAPAEQVWAVLNDYEHFRETFPRLTAFQAARQPDGTIEMSGVLGSRLWGHYAFTSTVHHEASPGHYRSWWNQPGGRLTVNQGGWDVQAQGPGTCLLVLHLDAEVRPVPGFLVREVLLARVVAVVEGVRDRALAKRPS